MIVGISSADCLTAQWIDRLSCSIHINHISVWILIRPGRYWVHHANLHHSGIQPSRSGWNIVRKSPAGVYRNPGCTFRERERFAIRADDRADWAIGVVDKDSRVACFHIVAVVSALLCGEYVEVVVVIAGDGEVPHPAVMVLGGGSAVGGCQRAVRGLEVLARFEVVCRNELVQIRVPEQVV
jgi:hypothetical protein